MASILALPNLSPACAGTLRDASEARLLALIAQGHEDAFGEIVERHEREIRAACARKVGLDHAADITQQAFLHALMALRRGGGPAEPEALRPWLFLIARNCCIDHLRSRGPETLELTHAIDGVPQPPQIVEQRDQVRRTVNLLQVLPREQRRALVARELEGRSYDEISAELGATDGGVRQMIFRARSAVRRGVAALVPVPRLLLALRGGESATALLSPHGDAVLGCLVIALSGCAPFVATGAADHVADRGPVARHAPAHARPHARAAAAAPDAAATPVDALPMAHQQRRVVLPAAQPVRRHHAVRTHRVAAPHVHRPAMPGPASGGTGPVAAPPATPSAPVLASTSPAVAPAAALPATAPAAPAAEAPVGAPADDTDSKTTGSSIDVPAPVSPSKGHGQGHGEGSPKGLPPGQAKKAELPVRAAPAPAPDPPAPAAETPPPAELVPQAPAPSDPAPGNGRGHGHGKGHEH